jgi:UDP:flavonoid glycosyltransferase YjiC (YdhE family)
MRPRVTGKCGCSTLPAVRALFSAGAGFSHITPLLPLATAVRDAGHDVLFVTGAEAVQHAGDLPTAAVGGGAGDGFAEYLARFDRAELMRLSADERLAHLITHLMVEMSAAARLPEMRAVVESWRPGVVVAGIGEFAAVLAAELAGVPYVVHAISPPKTAAVMAGGWRMADTILRSHGARLTDPRQVPYLDIWPAGLRPPGVEWDLPTRWPIRPENVSPAAGSRPSVVEGLENRPTVYVTGGTSHHGRSAVLDTAVSALRDEPVNVVVTTGRDGDPNRFGALPKSVRVERFVPQRDLLPHVDLVLCHGGAGSVLGALAHGLPLVLWPLATDQFDAAAHVAGAGAGLVLDASSSTVDGVRAAVRAVLADPEYRVSAGQLRAEIGAMPAAVDVAERLREYAAG